MTEYVLIEASKDGERKTFQGSKSLSIIQPRLLQCYVAGFSDFEPSYDDILCKHGWQSHSIREMPEDYITERHEWTPYSDYVVLEISDTLEGFKWRLNVNADIGQWRHSKSNEAVNGKYAYFWDYWEGLFPINRLIELKPIGEPIKRS